MQAAVCLFQTQWGQRPMTNPQNGGWHFTQINHGGGLGTTPPAFDHQIQLLFEALFDRPTVTERLFVAGER